jgi:hypothetical protein
MELKAQRKSGDEWNKHTCTQKRLAKMVPRAFWSWRKKNKFDLPYLFTTFGYSPQFLFNIQRKGRR